MLMLAAACYQAGYSQEDTTKSREAYDTIRVGSIIIVNKGGSNYDVTNHSTYKKRTYKRSNISTNWLVFDIGYSGFDDKTNYNTAEAQGLGLRVTEFRNKSRLNSKLLLRTQRPRRRRGC